jgi:hypothetical protein
MARLAQVSEAWLLCALGVAGCTGAPQAAPDGQAVAPSLCPADQVPDGVTIAGTITIGTGVEFRPILAGAKLPIIAPEGQGSAMFLIHPRIHGLEPGDSSDNSNPANPLTLVSAWNEAGEQLSPLDCLPYSLPYRPAADADDAYDLGFQRQLMIRSTFGEAELDGARVRLVVEVLDYEGRYSAEDVWVVADWTSQ